MDISNWKSIIDNNGGTEKIAKLIFDNGSSVTFKSDETFASKITMDMTNEAWIIKHANINGVQFNGNAVAATEVIDNGQLTTIIFADKTAIDKTW